MAKGKTDLLDSKQMISDYLNGASNYMLKKYLKVGMPVVFLNGRWLAHKENIEEFCKVFTRKKANNIPDKRRE